MENGGAKNERRSCNRCLLSESKKQGRKERQLLWLLLLTECRQHADRRAIGESRHKAPPPRIERTNVETNWVELSSSQAPKPPTRRDDSPRSISPNAPPFTFHTRLTSEKQREKMRQLTSKRKKKRYTLVTWESRISPNINKKTLPKTRS